MPDFERVIDQLRLELAKRPEDFARAQGYIAGKRFARKQIAIAFALAVAFAVIVLTLLHTSQ